MSASPGRCERLADIADCNSDVWAVLKEMSENAHTTVVSTSVSFTESSLVFVALLRRLDNRSRHRFALVAAETQDVQNVLEVRLTWCNVDGVRISPCSRCTEVAVL